MNTSLIPRSQVAERLHVSERLLLRYESRGLVRSIRSETVEGYEPAEIRRIWSILSLQRDLGVNLAGVEAILRLRAQFDHLHLRVSLLSGELLEAIETLGAVGTDDAS